MAIFQINLCTLQAGLVEELIEFSALDNIHELTCVSLLGVCIDDVRCQLLSNSHSCKTSKSVLPSLLNSSPGSNKAKTDSLEHDKDDLPEVLREEDVGTVSIKAVHLQLRRLLKDANFSEGIVLTAIPENKSKVMFTFENDVTKLFSPVSTKLGNKVRRSSSARTQKESSKRPIERHVSHDPPRGMEDRTSLRSVEIEENPFDAAPQPKLLRQKSLSREKQDEGSHHRSSKDKKDLLSRHSIGYVMFECGLEDISITAVRRLGYKDKSPTTLVHENEEVAKNVHQTQSKVKTEMRGQRSRTDSQSQGPSTKGQQGRTSDGEQCTVQIDNDPLGVEPTMPIKIEEIYSSTNSVHSWDSRISIPSDCGSLSDTEMLEGDASSGMLNLKTVWFNFAAPPPLPIKRKADFTK